MLIKSSAKKPNVDVSNPRNLSFDMPWEQWYSNQFIELNQSCFAIALSWILMQMAATQKDGFCHEDVMTWKRFPDYWPFIRRIHQAQGDSAHKWPLTQKKNVWTVVIRFWEHRDWETYFSEHIWWSRRLEVYDDVIKWKHFPRHWPFVRRILRSPVNCHNKSQWRRALMFSFMCAWTNRWVNNRDAVDLRRHLSLSLYWFREYKTGNIAAELPIWRTQRLETIFGNHWYWKYFWGLGNVLARNDVLGTSGLGNVGMGKRAKVWGVSPRTRKPEGIITVTS